MVGSVLVDVASLDGQLCNGQSLCSGSSNN